MKPLPIRWKFALWSAVSTTAAVLVFAGGTLVNLYYEQLEAIDMEIGAEAKVLVRRHAGTEGPLPPAGIDFHPWMGYAMFTRDGTLAHSSPQLDGAMARLALSSPAPKSHRRDERRWRLAAFATEDGRTVVVGYDLAEMKEIFQDLLLSYAVSLPFVLFAATFGGLWVARHALRPLRQLADAAGSIGPAQLAVRVPEPPVNDEVQKLAHAFNGMLTRLEQAFTQTQRFAADASHELRTPLTIMRTDVDQLLRNPGDATAQEEKLVSLQVEISRLDRITEHLLLLARFDAGQVRPPHTSVDFTAVVREACDDAELIAATEDVTLACEARGTVRVTGDEILLRRVVLNLLDNAVRHNERGGRVECRLGYDTRSVALRVRNTGPGIPAAARASLFQRFFRADPARSRGGHGLGLALAREIARSHRGELEHVDAEAGWTEFVLRLPIASTETAQAVGESPEQRLRG
ncbi:MAG: ATP-binding protein [Opitutaceae bacterium]|nr:ATP-binding protein [Opitutaceae bacterium]